MSQNADRLNRLQIREQEQINRERRAQAEVAERRQTDAVRKTKSQYSHVRSHGYGGGADGTGAPSGGPGQRGGGSAGGDDAVIRVYVRECDADAARNYTYRESEGLEEAGGGGGAGGTQRLPAVQRAQRVNAADSPVLAPGRRPSAPENAASPPAPNKGKVPRYIQQRKAELAAEKEAVVAESERRREQAMIPPGHRLVSAEEKAQTLAGLDAREADLEAQLGKIPIRFDTQAIRNRRSNIEEELKEIEASRLKYRAKKALYVPLR